MKKVPCPAPCWRVALELVAASAPAAGRLRAVGQPPSCAEVLPVARAPWRRPTGVVVYDGAGQRALSFHRSDESCAEDLIQQVCKLAKYIQITASLYVHKSG